MKFIATLAIAAAVRLSIDEEKVTAAQIFKECNTDGDKDLDYEEVVTCMNKHKVSPADQKKYGSALLKFAYIPKSNWEAVAEAISGLTGGKISVAEASAAIEACDANNNDMLHYKEVKACLKKH